MEHSLTNDSGANASSSRKAWRINACPGRTGATIAIVLLSALCCRCGGTATPTSSNTPPATSPQTWADEFDGPANTLPDPSKWTYDLGNNNGWGNRELETYTNSLQNVHLDGAGRLVIHVDRSGSTYTSARIKTQGLISARYGRIEARIRLPFGQGIWPAFWMLGKNINKVGWPRCGEIDIMENIGREPAKAHGTIHGPGYSGANGIGAAYNLSTGAFADDFHVFAIEWEPGGAIRWYVDGNHYQTRTQADLPAGAVWVFDRPFFILLNLAVGGSWPGNPDATTVFPQRMYVDYVRVYQ